MVSIDVAMQSTSEEILEKVEDIQAIQSENKLIKHQTFTTSNSTSARTVLDITGSGGLLMFNLHNLYLKASTTGHIKITVDGADYMNTSLKNTTSAHYTTGIICGVAGFHRFSSYNTNGWAYLINTGNGLTQMSSALYVAKCPLESSTSTVSITNKTILEHIIPNPIKFNESLKISVLSNSDTVSLGEVQYYLSE